MSGSSLARRLPGVLLPSKVDALDRRGEAFQKLLPLNDYLVAKLRCNASRMPTVTVGRRALASLFAKKNARISGRLSGSCRRDYTQPGYLKEPMRVDQLNDPLALMYSLVYQKVQSSTGSTVMAL